MNHRYLPKPKEPVTHHSGQNFPAHADLEPKAISRQKSLHKSVTFSKLTAVKCEELPPEPESEFAASETGSGQSYTSLTNGEGHSDQLFGETTPIENAEEKSSKQKKKVLVLDLDETLIRAKRPNERIVGQGEKVEINTISYLDQNYETDEIEFYVRPYAKELLSTLSTFYEIIVCIFKLDVTIGVHIWLAKLCRRHGKVLRSRKAVRFQSTLEKRLLQNRRGICERPTSYQKHRSEADRHRR